MHMEEPKEVKPEPVYGYCMGNGIASILDTDLYKFSVSYAYFRTYPLAEGEFVFKDRNKEDVGVYPGFMDVMEECVERLGRISLGDDEKEWCIRNIPYIPATYWEWLSGFRFDPHKIKMWLDEDGVFNCSVTDSMYKVTLYEIPVLATFSMVRNMMATGVAGKEEERKVVDEAVRRTEEKMETANSEGLSFSEFGTRRRFSRKVHEAVVNTIYTRSDTCAGTSNVYYAMMTGMKPVGTFPHEWVMFHGAVFGYKRANYLSLEDWIKVYDGNLGIALVDTYTTDSFLRTLTRKQALLLQGFRQDSGDELEVGKKIIRRLREFGIDPRTKTVVFSNALDFPKAISVNREFAGLVKASFGIGTNLTCDTGIPGYRPCNVVMKLMRCRMSARDPWEECIKISDDSGKVMGDSTEYAIAKRELHLG